MARRRGRRPRQRPQPPSTSGAPTASATTSPRSKERLGADAPTDSWALVFDPEYAAKLADCGITMLDTASEMVPLALAYLGLPPDSTGAGGSREGRGALRRGAPLRALLQRHAVQHRPRRRRGLRLGRLLRRHLHRGRPGGGGRSRSPTRCRRRGRCSGSTCWRSPPTRRTPTRRMPSSTSCSAPRTSPRSPTRVFYPNANARAAAVRRPRDPRRPGDLSNARGDGAPLPAAGARRARRPGADAALDQGPHRPVIAADFLRARHSAGDVAILLCYFRLHDGGTGCGVESALS